MIMGRKDTISLMSIIATTLLVMSILVAPNASAAVVDDVNKFGTEAANSQTETGVNDLDTMTSGIERHLTDGPNGKYFDKEAAQAAGENQFVIEAGENFNMIMEQNHEGQSRGDGEDGAMQKELSVPIWGNWCGPGHSGPEPPVDTLDTLCMCHDKCYAARGYFNCYCDAQLKAEIDRFAHRMTPRERSMAAAVKMAFSVGLCNPF